MSDGQSEARTEMDGGGLQFSTIIKRKRGRPRKLHPPAEPPPPPLPEPVDVRLHVHDVVQITSPQHQHYGAIFIVGDIRPPQIHGFMLMAQGEKRFITAEDGQYSKIGRSFVGARVMCSQEWLDKYKPV